MEVDTIQLEIIQSGENT